MKPINPATHVLTADLYRALNGGTVTGRFPCSAPNRANEPKIVVDAKGAAMLARIDFSAMELRVAAHLMSKEGQA